MHYADLSHEGAKSKLSAQTMELIWSEQNESFRVKSELGNNPRLDRRRYRKPLTVTLILQQPLIPVKCMWERQTRTIRKILYNQLKEQLLNNEAL